MHSDMTNQKSRSMNFAQIITKSYEENGERELVLFQVKLCQRAHRRGAFFQTPCTWNSLAIRDTACPIKSCKKRFIISRAGTLRERVCVCDVQTVRTSVTWLRCWGSQTHMLLSASSSSTLYSFFTTLASVARPLAVIISSYWSVCVCECLCTWLHQMRCDALGSADA